MPCCARLKVGAGTPVYAALSFVPERVEPYAENKNNNASESAVGVSGPACTNNNATESMSYKFV